MVYLSLIHYLPPLLITSDPKSPPPTLLQPSSFHPTHHQAANTLHISSPIGSKQCWILKQENPLNTNSSEKIQSTKNYGTNPTPTKLDASAKASAPTPLDPVKASRSLTLPLLPTTTTSHRTDASK